MFPTTPLTPATMKRTAHLLLLTTCFLALFGCALFRPYKIPIQQGILLTPAMIQQLKPGMTETQVQYVLGDPNLKDPTQPNTWYYIYRIEQDYLPATQKMLMLTFTDGKLTGMQGDYPPPTLLQGAPSTSLST